MAFSLAEKLYANKRYEETVEVLGSKFTFVVLSNPDETEISRGFSAENLMEYAEAKKIPTLARGIIAIDGQPWAEANEIQQLLRSDKPITLAQAVETELRKDKYSSPVIDAIYDAYMDFKAKYQKEINASKKGSPAKKADPVG